MFRRLTSTPLRRLFIVVSLFLVTVVLPLVLWASTILLRLLFLVSLFVGVFAFFALVMAAVYYAGQLFDVVLRWIERGEFRWP